MTAYDALEFVEGLTAGSKEQDPAYTARKR
jgi:hypothetical protein